MDCTCYWYTSLDEIRKANPEALDSYGSGRSLFIKNAKLSRIIEFLHPSHKDRFSTRKLFSGKGLSVKRTQSILNAWREEIPLLPPRIIVENGFVYIEDGNHRMNAAYCLGAEYIPIEFVIPESDSSESYT